MSVSESFRLKYCMMLGPWCTSRYHQIIQLYISGDCICHHRPLSAHADLLRFVDQMGSRWWAHEPHVPSRRQGLPYTESKAPSTGEVWRVVKHMVQQPIQHCHSSTMTRRFAQAICCRMAVSMSAFVGSHAWVRGEVCAGHW